jgi:hypothetical protein
MDRNMMAEIRNMICTIICELRSFKKKQQNTSIIVKTLSWKKLKHTFSPYDSMLPIS